MIELINNIQESMNKKKSSEEIALDLSGKSDRYCELAKQYAQNINILCAKRRESIPLFGDISPFLTQSAQDLILHFETTKENNILQNTDLFDPQYKLTPEFQIVPQVGHQCKITALSMANNFLNSGNKIPLHKNHDKTVHTSVRKIAKEEGSIQGEVLSPEQLIRIGNKINLNSKAVKPASYSEYQAFVSTSISHNKPLIAFFVVDTNTELPIIDVKKIPEGNFEKYEHACVITGYNPATDMVRITHWGKHHFTPLKNLFDSSQLLVERRSEERYFHYTKVEKFFDKGAKKRKWNMLDCYNASFRIN